MLKLSLILIAGSCISLSCNIDRENIQNTQKGQMTPELVRGEELFRMHCITCHTLGYIDMQPDFTRKTWEKITDKMIKSFGAPIPDSAAVEIVDYLMFVKGLKE